MSFNQAIGFWDLVILAFKLMNHVFLFYSLYKTL